MLILLTNVIRRQRHPHELGHCILFRAVPPDLQQQLVQLRQFLFDLGVVSYTYEL